MSSPTSNSASVSLIDPSQSLGAALIYGTKWGGGYGVGVTLTYSFPTGSATFITPYGYYGGSGEFTNWFSLSATERSGAVTALQAWSSVANIAFQSSSDDSTTVGDIRIAATTVGSPDEAAHAYFPSSNPSGGDVWMRHGTWHIDSNSAVAPGSYDYLALVHELGHALGLKHSFETSQFSQSTLPGVFDNFFYTVMSYTAKFGVSGNYATFYPTTPMYFDLIAIQDLYGRAAHNSGSTTYIFTAGNRYFQTIDDTGGIDTIAYSGSQGSVISLNQGDFSALSDPIGFSDGSSTRYTVAIGPGTVIENATGGSGNDTIIGNSANNVLIGGAGNDALIGGVGVDTLMGSSGGDRFVFDNGSLPAGGANYDNIVDFNRGNLGVYASSERDAFDFTALLGASYNHGSGHPVSTLVRLVEDQDGAYANVQVDLNGPSGGANWTTVGHVTGIHQGEYANALLDYTLPVQRLEFQTDTAPTSDFNHDGKADLLLRNDGGVLAIWTLNGSTRLTNSNLNSAPGSDWHVVGTGDFNGDSKGDIVWRHDNGTVVFWEMNGSQILSGNALGSAPGNDWHIAGVGDFNGDGRSDLLWRNDNGQVVDWMMNSTQIIGSGTLGAPDNSWHIAGAGDFNGDGKTDVLWRNDNGTVASWFIDGDHIVSGGNIGAPSADWHIVGTGDFNADGKSDILWRNDNGTVAAWLLNGTQILSGGNIGGPGNEWHVAGTGDVNHDGTSDILWQNDSGAVAVWAVLGTQILDGGTIGAVAEDWKTVTHHYDFV